MFRVLNNIYIKKTGVLILFLFIVVNILISQEIPQIQAIGTTIYFFEGKAKIEIDKNDQYYIFPHRLVYIRQQQKQEYMEYTLEFYDFYGNKIAQLDRIEGEICFVFAESGERVLAGQISALTLQNESFLYDLNGRLINVLTHDIRTKQIGITEDGEYFWFAAEKTRFLQPGEKSINTYSKLYIWNHIMIFDVHTGNFIAEYSTLDSNFSFLLNGKRYIIPVSLPDSAP
ncbi:MAG: hypothetical protein LBJ31_08105 [Treponema sp.]|nr:hypothetical protein [Treponema sp.]